MKDRRGRREKEGRENEGRRKKRFSLYVTVNIVPVKMFRGSFLLPFPLALRPLPHLLPPSYILPSCPSIPSLTLFLLLRCVML